MESAFPLNVKVCQCLVVIIKLLPCKDQPLLVFGEAGFFKHFRSQCAECCVWYNAKRLSFACQRLQKDVHDQKLMQMA